MVKKKQSKKYGDLFQYLSNQELIDQHLIQGLYSAKITINKDTGKKEYHNVAGWNEISEDKLTGKRISKDYYANIILRQNPENNPDKFFVCIDVDNREDSDKLIESYKDSNYQHFTTGTYSFSDKLHLYVIVENYEQLKDIVFNNKYIKPEKDKDGNDKIGDSFEIFTTDSNKQIIECSVSKPDKSLFDNLKPEPIGKAKFEAMLIELGVDYSYNKLEVIKKDFKAVDSKHTGNRDLREILGLTPDKYKRVSCPFHPESHPSCLISDNGELLTDLHDGEKYTCNKEGTAILRIGTNEVVKELTTCNSNNLKELKTKLIKYLQQSGIIDDNELLIEKEEKKGKPSKFIIDKLNKEIDEARKKLKKLNVTEEDKEAYPNYKALENIIRGSPKMQVWGLEKELNLKQVITGDKSTNSDYKYYIFEDDHFKQITLGGLGAKLRYDYLTHINKTETANILNYLQRNDKIHDNIIGFKNHLIDTKTLNISPKTHKKLYVKEFGVMEDDEVKYRLEYIKDTNFINLKKEKTYIEERIQEILIPKQVLLKLNSAKTANELQELSTEYEYELKKYKDYIERLGGMVYQKHKSGAFYVGDGDNGKSLLGVIIDLIYNRNVHGISSDELKNSNFNYVLTKGTHGLIFDELERSSFDGLVAVLKKNIGGGVKQTARGFKSDKIINYDEVGFVWCFSNEIPVIPLTETALFERIDILELPNKFVRKDEDKLKDNEIKAKSINELQKNLSKDIIGLSWLISIAIKLYRELIKNNNSFTCKQTSEETKSFYTKKDHLLNYLSEYIIIDPLGELTNKDIREEYGEYLINNDINIPLPEPKQLSKDIGYHLKDLFGDKRGTFDLPSGKAYRLGIKPINRPEPDIEYSEGILTLNDFNKDNSDILNQEKYEKYILKLSKDKDIWDNFTNKDSMIKYSIKNGFNFEKKELMKAYENLLNFNKINEPLK